MLLWRAADLHVAFLGRIPNTRRFSELACYPDNERIDGVLALLASEGSCAELPSPVPRSCHGLLEPCAGEARKCAAFAGASPAAYCREASSEEVEMDRVTLTVVLGALLFGCVLVPPPAAATDQPPSPAVPAGQASGGQEAGGALPDAQSGTDVSVDSAWRSTTMANAARDPYWSASVRSEILANPPLQAVIEDKCSTCHAPMARTSEALRALAASHA